MLLGGNAKYRGLAAFGLLKEDFRLDRDPDDYHKASDGVIGVIDVEEMLMSPGPAAPGSGASDDDEVGPSAAAVSAAAVSAAAVAFDAEALSTILNCIETTFAALTLTSKAQQDALGEEV